MQHPFPSRPTIGLGTIRGAKDDLLGLKEDIIIGHLIPAGSAIYRYAEIDIEPPEGYEAPPPRVEEPVPQPLTAAVLIGEEE
jgi:DNA-directed RNA polymerase subunit beta'